MQPKLRKDGTTRFTRHSEDGTLTVLLTFGGTHATVEDALAAVRDGRAGVTITTVMPDGTAITGRIAPEK